jgi:hypothetical protein
MEDYGLQATLSPVEEEILKAHISGFTSVFEAQQILGDDSFRVKDVLTGKELEIRDSAAKKHIVVWDLLMMRVYNLKGEHKITGNILSISRMLKEGLISFLNLEFEKFKEETGMAEWPQFLKRKAYTIPHYIQDLLKKKPVLLTGEDSKMVIAKAMFELKFFDRALHILTNEYDFMPGKSEDSNVKNFVWLKRGQSREFGKVNYERQNAMLFQTKIIHESGKLEWTVLGNLALVSNGLILECFSKEILEAGKGRLLEVLKDCIHHKADSFEDMGQRMQNTGQGKKEKESEPLSEEKKFYMSSYLENYYKEWMDEKIPALDGKTPREAANDGEGRQKLLGMLRDLENDQERKRKKGEPCFDVGFMKKELGLSEG